MRWTTLLATVLWTTVCARTFQELHNIPQLRSTDCSGSGRRVQRTHRIARQGWLIHVFLVFWRLNFPGRLFPAPFRFDWKYKQLLYYEYSPPNTSKDCCLHCTLLNRNLQCRLINHKLLWGLFNRNVNCALFYYSLHCALFNRNLQMACSYSGILKVHCRVS